MSMQCSATTKTGSQCKRSVVADTLFCKAHQAHIVAPDTTAPINNPFSYEVPTMPTPTTTAPINRRPTKRPHKPRMSGASVQSASK